MKNLRTLLLITQLIFSGNICFSQDIKDWFKAGSKPGLYEIGESEEKYSGKTVYYIKSTENVSDGFGTIMQQQTPGKYLSKRINMSGYIKNQSVDKYAGMWFRVDGYTPGTILGFDNMGNRPIEGTKNWQKYEIVLDVPDTSAAIAYGVLLSGNGTVWFSEITFEEVGKDIPVTNMLTETVQESLTDKKMDEIPAELKNIPDGIKVLNSPLNVLAVRTKEDTANYYWFHSTTVKAVNEDLEITEFGTYTWVQDRWVFGTVTGKPFEPKDFADWYDCKNAFLEKGKTYGDKNNWFRSPALQRATSLWYYIGKNKKGELFKGISIVNYLPEEKK